MRIYLDNCVLNRPFDDQRQTRIRHETQAISAIRERIIANKLELTWSYVIDLEITKNPFQDRRESAGSWKELSILEVGPSIEIVSDAIDLRNSGLRDIDSLHVACAIASRSDYFITTDDAILKKTKIVRRIVLNSPVELWEKIR